MIVISKSLYKTIGFNTSIQFVGKIASVLLGLTTVFILTRYLGVSGYGDFILVFAYMSFFGIIADFGLQLTIVRELAQNNTQSDKIYGTYLWLKTRLVALSIFLALVFLLFFRYSQTINIGIIIAALAVGISSLTGYGTTIFQSKLRLDFVTYIDIFTKIITVFLIFVFVSLKLNFYFIVSTVIVGNLSGLLLSIFFLKRFMDFSFKYDKELAIKIIKWSLPIGITSFFSLAYFRLDTIMLSVMKSQSEVGIYSLAYKILENILVLWGFYMASAYPILANLKSDKNKLLDLLKKSMLFASILSVFIILIGFIFAPFLISIFGGSRFNDSILPFKILLFSVPFFFLDNFMYNLLLINKEFKLILYGMTLALLVNFVFNFIFIPKTGYIAASYITILSEIILATFYLIVFMKNKSRFI